MQHYNSSCSFQGNLKVWPKTCFTFYKSTKINCCNLVSRCLQKSSLTEDSHHLVELSSAGYGSEVMVLLYIRTLLKFCSFATFTLIGPTQRCKRPPISPAAHWGLGKMHFRNAISAFAVWVYAPAFHRNLVHCLFDTCLKSLHYLISPKFTRHPRRRRRLWFSTLPPPTLRFMCGSLSSYCLLSCKFRVTRWRLGVYLPFVTPRLSDAVLAPVVSQ